MSKFFNELLRRNVIKAAVAYAVVAWVLLQILGIVLPIVEAPEWVMKTLMLLMIIGFPVWVVISWVYEITTEGFKKTAKVSKDQSITASTSKRLNILILIGLVVAIAVALLRPNTNLIKTEDGQYAIAVLPFEDLSAEGDGNWFCIGVTEDILTYLSKIKDLRVISRTSVMQYKNHEKSIPEIAQELGVSYVVEGSVRKQGDKVLVTAQLINAKDNHLWADNYEENLDDVFKIQQEISKKIVQQLKTVISPEVEELLNSSSTTNVEAYHLFLKGRAIADNRIVEDIEKSIEFYERAITLDPNYADAYAEIAFSTFFLWDEGVLDFTEALQKCRDYINKALAINPKTSRAYAVSAMLYVEEKKFDLAKENYEKAIIINPNDVTAHHGYSLYYRCKEVFDAKKALYHINLAQQLDPLSMPINYNKIMSLLINDKIDEAQEHYNKTSYMFDYHLQCSAEGYINSIKNNDLTEMFEAFKTRLEKEPNNSDLHSDLSYNYRAVWNDYNNALKHAKRAFELNSTSGNLAEKLLYELFWNQQFKEAQALLNDPKVFDLFDDVTKAVLNQDYYAFQGDFKKAIPYNDQLKALNLKRYYFERTRLYSRMGDKITVNEMMNIANNEISDDNKAQIFANLKLNDSMYYYLHRFTKIKDNVTKLHNSLEINGRIEFDPYRMEPRYIAFLKANYFPVSDE